MLCYCRVQPVAMPGASAPLTSPNLNMVTVQMATNCSQVSQIASLSLADTPSPAVGTSTVFDLQSTGPTSDHQQIAVYRPSTDVGPFASNAAMLSSANTSPISSDACSDSTAGSRIFEWQVWPWLCYSLFTVHTSDSA